MDAELVIKGGTLVTPDGVRRGGLAIADGRIVAVGADATLPDARDRFDATGAMVLPGLIDTHVHARDPSVDAREDFASATAAAAVGGITTILEMPISTPSVHDRRTFEARAAIVEPKAHVDFGLYGGAAGDNVDTIEEQAAAGAVAFKTFRTAAPAGREGEFIGLCAPDPDDYRRALSRIARTGRVSVVHAEDAGLLASAGVVLQAAGDRGPMSHARWRPEMVELVSAAECLALAREAGARIELAHCSTPRAIDLATHARDAGLSVTVETCPHYLFLTEADLARHGPYAKINPALRTEEAVAGLWDRLGRGEIDVIGSDHSPFLVEEKAPFADDLWGALPGAPGLEALLPLMLTAVAEGRLSWPRLVEVTSANAARIFGLGSKGGLRVDADADVVIVDPDRRWTIDTSRWLTRSRGTAAIWHGRDVTGAPIATFVRGRPVARDGALVGARGYGRLVRPD